MDSSKCRGTSKACYSVEFVFGHLQQLYKFCWFLPLHSCWKCRNQIELAESELHVFRTRQPVLLECLVSWFIRSKSSFADQLKLRTSLYSRSFRCAMAPFWKYAIRRLFETGSPKTLEQWTKRNHRQKAFTVSVGLC